MFDQWNNLLNLRLRVLLLCRVTVQNYTALSLAFHLPCNWKGSTWSSTVGGGDTFLGILFIPKSQPSFAQEREQITHERHTMPEDEWWIYVFHWWGIGNREQLINNEMHLLLFVFSSYNWFKCYCVATQAEGEHTDGAMGTREIKKEKCIRMCEIFGMPPLPPLFFFSSTSSSSSS